LLYILYLSCHSSSSTLKSPSSIQSTITHSSPRISIFTGNFTPRDQRCAPGIILPYQKMSDRVEQFQVKPLSSLSQFKVIKQYTPSCIHDAQNLLNDYVAER
jgi:hypothetical protein